MRRRGIIVSIVLLAAACGRGRVTPPAPDPGSRRTTSAGDVVGFVGRYGSFAWMGVPYAAPPTGDRRWRAPAPPAAWTGVRDALVPGAPCVQYASPLGGIQTAPANTPVGDEDCLYVNVYAPRTATPASRLPVMVWLHGGGNTIGAGHLYDGGNLAATENVVVVTVNYRLGPFGWLRHAALRAGAGDDAERSGNFAVLDLVRALEWVRDDAVAFGGDPGRVTIFGESAGGTNVLALLLAPQARGLFQRAIIESGGLRVTDADAAEAFDDDPTPGDADSSDEMLARLWVRDGRAPDRAAAKKALAATSPDAVAAYLRGKSAREVLAAYTPIPGIGMIRMPMVFADGAVLPRDPVLARLARPDGWNRVPVIVGTNRDENKLFLFGDPRWVRRWLWVVPQARDPDRYDATAEAMAKMWKATGADEIATAIQSSGWNDVYVYRFDWHEEPTILGSDLSRLLGASHGFEIPFVFGHFDLGREANRLFTAENEPGRRELSATMMDHWGVFAATGRPRDGWPTWGPELAVAGVLAGGQRVGSVSGRYLVFDTRADGGCHVATDTPSRDAVLAGVERDPRLSAPRDRCLVYHELVAWSGVMTRAAFDEKCPALPFDGYPWS